MIKNSTGFTFDLNIVANIPPVEHRCLLTNSSRGDLGGLNLRARCRDSTRLDIFLTLASEAHWELSSWENKYLAFALG